MLAGIRSRRNTRPGNRNRQCARRKDRGVSSANCAGRHHPVAERKSRRSIIRPQGTDEEAYSLPSKGDRATKGLLPGERDSSPRG